MRDADAWQPSKIVQGADGRWVPNPDYVRGGSLFAAGLLADALVPVLEREARGRFLDAGCGDVPYYGVYRNLASAVTCVDWAESSHGARHLDQIVDLNADLPFGEAAFDTVLLADVLEHIAQPARLVAELARVLAPGGKLIVSVPFLYWVHEAPHDYFRYTEYGLRHLCSQAGLAVEECEPYGGHPDVLVDLVGKVLARSKRTGTVFASACRGLLRVPPAPRLRARTRRSFPLGYVMVARPAETPTHTNADLAADQGVEQHLDDLESRGLLKRAPLAPTSEITSSPGPEPAGGWSAVDALVAERQQLPTRLGE